MAVARAPLTPDAEQAGFWLEAVLSYGAKAPPLSPRHRGHRTRRSPKGDRMAQGNGQARGDEVGWLGWEELALRVHPSHRATFVGSDEEPLVACLACGGYGSFEAFNLTGCCKPHEAKVKYGRRRAVQRLGRGIHPGNDGIRIAIDPMRDAPGLPEARQLEVSPPQPQQRRLRLGRKTCLGCAPRPPPAWVVTGRTPKDRRCLEKPDRAGLPKGP